MQVSEKQLAMFKELCQKRGRELEDPTAREWALKLMSLVAITRRTLATNENDYGQTQKK